MYFNVTREVLFNSLMLVSKSSLYCKWSQVWVDWIRYHKRLQVTPKKTFDSQACKNRIVNCSHDWCHNCHRVVKDHLPFGSPGLKDGTFYSLVSLGLAPQLDVHRGGQVQHLLAVLLHHPLVDHQCWSFKRRLNNHLDCLIWGSCSSTFSATTSQRTILSSTRVGPYRYPSLWGPFSEQ